ncbi:amine dehydrogenase large subunit [Rubellimicrobium aerolatum]|uniref:Amine dehydrogenase large subunit n=1 Tax=Rubellimicrobium aerolatum TaxID=490979 RepID=A0ABW0SAH0_9RHOB|nr:amine dehydrogenase large subunit [Rubellimicrobium aerolatum]MBP1805252.1 methylamine dehydrogenase heavy chain [Rubellimicrobium aerolatum]
MRLQAFIGAASLALAAPAMAQDAEFVPETVSVQERIAPGANVFVMDQNWSGASKINVLGADDLSMKGNLSVGREGQMLLSADGATLYTTSGYARRITYGEMEAVVHEFDVATLTHRREFTISNKRAMVESQPALLGFADGERFLLVQNATPATSIAVVDLARGEQIAEIPTPGCWGALATQGRGFLTLCGDGTVQAFAFEPDGSFGEPVRSAAPIFDPDADALFTNPARVGADFVFASFGGNLLRVAMVDGVPTLVDSFSITEGVEGDWAPGGSEVIAYHAPSGTAFVLMHSGAEEGSHKDGAEEIWAVDLDAKAVLYRSPAHHENSIAAGQGETPVLFAVGESSTLTRYEVDPEARFAAKPAGEAEKMGGFPALVLTSQ